MIIDHNSKSHKCKIFYWHENEEIVKYCLNNELYYRNLSSVENWVNNILLISTIKQE